MTNTIQLFVTHTLTLSRNDCRLVAEGYQTYERIRCRAGLRGNMLAISFADYVAPAERGARIEPYKRGTPLFTLSREPGRLVTRWKAYALKPENARSGIFFRRQPG